MKNKRSLYTIALILGFLLTSCQSKVDLIVHNANVYTLSQKNAKATAFVVNNGKFLDIGGEELLEQYSAKRYWIYRIYLFTPGLLIHIVIF